MKFIFACLISRVRTSSAHSRKPRRAQLTRTTFDRRFNHECTTTPRRPPQASEARFEDRLPQHEGADRSPRRWLGHQGQRQAVADPREGHEPGHAWSRNATAEATGVLSHKAGVVLTYRMASP